MRKGAVHEVVKFTTLIVADFNYWLDLIAWR